MKMPRIKTDCEVVKEAARAILDADDGSDAYDKACAEMVDALRYTAWRRARVFC
jgi:hypothetical protein